MAQVAENYDVIVVGGGIAGMTAASVAAESGARVRLVERTARLGGNARLSAGYFVKWPSLGALHTYVPDGDLALQRTLVEGFDPAVDWLEGHGVGLKPKRELERRSVREFKDGVPGDRRAAMARLAKACVDVGVDVGLSRRALQLQRDGTDWLITSRSGMERASSVILATGGFAASNGHLRKALGRRASTLTLRALPTATGDGLTLGESVGAGKTGDFQAFYGHTMVEAADPSTGWLDRTCYFARDSVMINDHGRRFGPESRSLFEETNAQVGLQQQGGRWWVVADRRTIESSIDSGARRWAAEMRSLGGLVLVAESLPDLVAQLSDYGVPSESSTEALSRRSRRHPEWPTSTPLYAIRTVAGITATCGGLAVDEDLRVRTTAGERIQGLFAAGVDVGRIFGRTYGGFLSWALASGHRAGKRAGDLRVE